MIQLTQQLGDMSTMFALGMRPQQIFASQIGQRNITADFGSYGRLLDAGLYFGLGDEIYLCTGISWAGTVATIRTTPTLRRHYTAQDLRLRPVMICQLTGDDGGGHMLKSMRTTTPTLDFVEVPLGLLS